MQQVGWIRYRVPFLTNPQTLVIRLGVGERMYSNGKFLVGFDLTNRTFSLPLELVEEMGHGDTWPSNVPAVDSAIPVRTPLSGRGATCSQGILSRFWDSLTASCAWVGTSRKVVDR